MKLATFEAGGRQAVGAVDVERREILDLARAAEHLDGAREPAFADMLSLIRSGAIGLARAQALAARWPQAAVRPLADVRLLSPLPRPEQLRDCLVFEQHLVNAVAQWEKMTGKPGQPISPHWYKRPTWYKGNRMSVVGHDTDVIWPPYAELMDYELELACVIGKPGRDIPREEALDHVFGFTIFNDFSARDLQVIERPLGMGPMKSKDFDTGNVLGPWIVTTDEIGDPQDLRMDVRINGEHRGGGNSAGMHHDFAAILAFISQSETLHPGEVIGSGTVPTGCGLESGTWLRPGDVVELEIEKIGVLRNRIVRA